MRSASILADRGWEVTVFGMQLHDTTTARFSELRAMVHLQQRPRRFPKVRYLVFAMRSLIETIRRRPHWVYVSDNFATPIGLIISLIPGVRTLYHEHDAPEPRVSGSVDWVMRRFREWFVPRARLSVVPSPGRVEALPAEAASGDRVVVVRNMPLRSECQQLVVRNPDEFRLVYVGTIVPARVPLTLIGALTLLPEPVVLWLVGYETVGAPGWVGVLRRHAREQGVEKRLRYLGFIPSFDRVHAELARCNLGLCLMRSEGETFNERTLAGASNKAFSYLACGIPLLVPDLPEWRAMFVVSGLARACRSESSRSIADAVHWFVSNPQETSRMGERGFRRITGAWNYETEFEPVLSVLEGDSGGTRQQSHRRVTA